PQRDRSFPYTTLFRSGDISSVYAFLQRSLLRHTTSILSSFCLSSSRIAPCDLPHRSAAGRAGTCGGCRNAGAREEAACHRETSRDRKSTRLNSSHVKI